MTGELFIHSQRPELRPYQFHAIEQLRQATREGKRRILLCAIMGSGKTVIASSIIASAREKSGARVLFVAHRRELIQQAAIQLMRYGVTDVGIIMADDARRDDDAPVQVASIDTLRRRTPPSADIVFLDECHRAMSNSNKRLLEWYPDALHIGLTASPARGDGQGLGEYYEHMIVCSKPSELIADGHLSAPVMYSSPVEVDLTGVRTLAGDYHEGDLASLLTRPKLLGNVVGEWQRLAENRRTIVFAVNIAHSEMLCRMFLDDGVAAEHLDGTTPKLERDDILMRLATGATKVVCSVGTLTEGFDCPPAKCAVLARPTKSVALYLQMAGRVLRPWEGVTPIILDHSGSLDRLGFPHDDREWTLEHGEKRDKGPAIRICPQCYLCLPAGTKKCECGYEWPIKAATELPETTGGQLVSRETAVPEDRRYYLKQVDEARGRGFKVGWVSFRFKDKYGKFAPWSWKQETDRLYAADPVWQEAVQTQTNRRMHWQNINAGKVDVTVTEGHADDDFFGQFGSDDEIPY